MNKVDKYYNSDKLKINTEKQKSLLQAEISQL